MRKPKVKEDLIPPFLKIGDEGWIQKFQQILIDYGINLPIPVKLTAIRDREQELGFQFPQSLRIMLTEIGCVNLDNFRLYPVHAMKTLENIWFKDFLFADEQKQLSKLLGISDASSENIIAIAPETGHCYLCSHDPARIQLKANSFDNLIQQMIIDLSWGYYGWPDSYIEQLASEVKHDLFR